MKKLIVIAIFGILIIGVIIALKEPTKYTEKKNYAIYKPVIKRP